MATEEYKKAELPAGVEPCPVCGAGVELWHYSEDFENGPISKVVCCANNLPIGPQDGIISNGCLLFMPPQDFYKATAREAVKYWNEYAKALSACRRKRNWQRATVLREVPPKAK